MAVIMGVAMKILERVPSRERCAEAGWYAYDLILDAPMDDAFIRSLRPLGSFVYMQMLKKPFFKIESDHYLLKGIRGTISSGWQYMGMIRRSWSGWNSGLWNRNRKRERVVQWIMGQEQKQKAEEGKERGNRYGG